ncbi:MAG TPA: helix-turn-helix transcriptional regulator [Saprospiraceae bacterium]|nr:helix-turn-helix transcriptional regulator [Saprospiraceae bacterium]
MGEKSVKQARVVRSPAIAAILEQLDPAQTNRVELRMMLAAKIYETMQQKGISKKQFAGMLGQQPSVVTKWLSGTHNFTADTLADIQRVLEISLFNFDVQSRQEKISIAFELVRKPESAEEFEIENLSIT